MSCKRKSRLEQKVNIYYNFFINNFINTFNFIQHTTRGMAIYGDMVVVSNDDSHNVTDDDSSDNVSVFDQNDKNKIVKIMMIAITLGISNVKDYDNETNNNDS